MLAEYACWRAGDVTVSTASCSRAVPGTKNAPDVTDVNLPNIIQNKQLVTLRHVGESWTFLHVVPRLA